MTHFLISEENPQGYKLEDILKVIRRDVILRCTKIVDDSRPEALHVLNNNMTILKIISEAILLAENSTRVLVKAFGPSVLGGPPRIGEP